MNRLLIAVTAISLAFPIAGAAQPTEQTAGAPRTLSTQEARNLVKTAHNNAQYAALAEYFTQKEQTYSMKRDAMLELWSVRASGIAVNQNKFPRPVDSAHNLYDYYAYETSQAAAQARHYRQLMSQTAPQP